MVGSDQTGTGNRRGGERITGAAMIAMTVLFGFTYTTFLLGRSEGGVERGGGRRPSALQPCSRHGRTLAAAAGSPPA